MTATTTAKQLDVKATAQVIRGRPGPALVGRSAIRILVTIAGPEATPLASLAEDAIQVHRVSGNSAADVHAEQQVVANFTEVLPSVYCLTLADEDDRAWEKLTFILTVIQGGGHASARVVVSVPGAP